MTVQITRGAVAVREAVEAHLVNKVRFLIDQARISWDLAGDKLPYPKRYDAFDPWETQEYPIIGAYVQRVRNFTRINNNAVGSPYRPLYTMQVAVWAEDTRFDGVKYRDPTPKGATRVRDDLVAIVRAALLEYPNLGQPNVFTFEEGTYGEEYFEPVKSMGEGSWVAGGVLNFQMYVNERNLLAGLGVVEETLFEAYLVGPTQEFQEQI